MLVDSGVQLVRPIRPGRRFCGSWRRFSRAISPMRIGGGPAQPINQLESVGDLQSTLSNWYLGQAGLEKVITPQAAAEAAAQVTRERVQKAAAGIRLDAIYMLAAQEAQKKEGEDE